METKVTHRLNQHKKRHSYTDLKVCVSATYVMALVITIVYCGMYWKLWTEADDYSRKSRLNPAYIQTSVSAYDRCGAPLELAVNTKWSVIYMFNAILYLCLSTFTVLLLVGAIKWQLLCSGCAGHCLGIVVQFVCIVCTGVWRYSDEGKSCAENNPDFKDHADKI